MIIRMFFARGLVHKRSDGHAIREDTTLHRRARAKKKKTLTELLSCSHFKDQGVRARISHRLCFTPASDEGCHLTDIRSDLFITGSSFNRSWTIFEPSHIPMPPLRIVINYFEVQSCSSETYFATEFQRNGNIETQTEQKRIPSNRFGFYFVYEGL